MNINAYIIAMLCYCFVKVIIGLYKYRKYCNNENTINNEESFYDAIYWLVSAAGVFECVIFALFFKIFFR